MNEQKILENTQRTRIIRFKLIETAKKHEKEEYNLKKEFLIACKKMFEKHQKERKKLKDDYENLSINE